MPLIGRGHMFIAQPPLYKVSKGKEEKYLNSDAELSEFIIRKATEEKVVKVDGNTYSGTELHHVLHALIEFDQLVKSLSRMGLAPDIVEEILGSGLAARTDFEFPISALR